MQVYRLCKKEFANDLTGTGAKLYGGRWNKINTPCVYTASSRALAILEFSVNVNELLIPDHLSMVTIEIDIKFVKEVLFKNLPRDWKLHPMSTTTQDIGTYMLEKGTKIIKVPSAIIEQEYNYILNPNVNPTAYRLIDIVDYPYDMRIKK